MNRPISTSLTLPEGYQHFDWYSEGKCNSHQVWLNDTKNLQEYLAANSESEGYLYTHHEIFLDDGLLKQTRSSPNWEGGIVTYSTCKHNMRTYSQPDGWEGMWLAGLCPSKCAGNCVLYIGMISHSFPSNYTLSGALRTSYEEAWQCKRASNNPRGDLYTPQRHLYKPDEVWNHHNYLEPANHTRSVEYYAKSPGSTSTRNDGKVPKWWRDLEYLQRGVRPTLFMLSPCWLFSRPLLWVAYRPGRAALLLTAGALANSLQRQPG